MTGELRRKAPVLRRLGWAVDDLGRGGKAMVVRFSLVPPEAGDRQATGRRQGAEAGDSERRRLPVSPALTCKDGETDTEAGEAGDETPFSLCPAIKEEKREEPDPPIRVWSETSPASPASPAMPAYASQCTVCGQLLLLVTPGRDTCAACSKVGAR